MATRKASAATDTVVAAQMAGPTDADGFPRDAAWRAARAIRFSHDWQGRNARKSLETAVQLLWSPAFLFLKFLAYFESITVFEDAEPSGRRDHLWDRDVAEVFLQAPGAAAHCYKEIEVSPNGQWIDLDIAPGKKGDLQSGLSRRVQKNEARKTWQAELALPMRSLTTEFNPAKAWRANFFRVEGAKEPRFYSAWRPTGTAVPNFHVPERFGTLLFDR